MHASWSLDDFQASAAKRFQRRCQFRSCIGAVGEDMTFAALDFLAGVKAPWSAAFRWS